MRGDDWSGRGHDRDRNHDRNDERDEHCNDERDRDRTDERDHDWSHRGHDKDNRNRDHGRFDDHPRERDDHRGEREDSRRERGDGDRRLLVDASVLITLADVDGFGLLERVAGAVVVPRAVADEVTADPASRALAESVDDGWIEIERADERAGDALADAAAHLGADDPTEGYAGDVALLALAMAFENAVVVTDDKPLRKACKALSIPLSGSIGVLIRAVERGDVPPTEAKDTLYAMDEVGARLDVQLVRRAERLIDDAAEE